MSRYTPRFRAAPEEAKYKRAPSVRSAEEAPPFQEPPYEEKTSYRRGNSAAPAYNAPPEAPYPEEGLTDDLTYWGDDDPAKEEWREKQSPVVFIMIVATVVVGMAILWFLFRWASGSSDLGNPPTILAEDMPYKVRPEQPGGVNIPHQDKLIYGRISGQNHQPAVEQLLPPPEQPVAMMHPQAAETYPPYQQPYPGQAPQQGPQQAPQQGAYPAQPGYYYPPQEGQAPEAAAHPAYPQPQNQQQPQQQVQYYPPQAAPVFPPQAKESAPYGQQGGVQGGTQDAETIDGIAEEDEVSSSPHREEESLPFVGPKNVVQPQVTAPAPVAEQTTDEDDLESLIATEAKKPLPGINGPKAGQVVGKGYRVQISTLPTKTAAESELRRLQQTGLLTGGRPHKLSIVKFSSQDGRAPLYRIMVGPFPGRSEATRYCSKIKGKVGCMVVAP